MATVGDADENAVTEAVTVHVGDVSPLLDWAEHTRKATNVVIAPVELHRRNLKLRLTDAKLPLEAFAFTGPAAVASSVLETAGKSTKALDRVDRLALLGEILGEENDAVERFRRVLGGEPRTSGNAVDQARRELEVLTNYHPRRIRAFRKVLESLPSPVAADARDVLEGTLAVERVLRQRAEKAPADGVLVRRAIRTIVNTGGSAWKDAYSTVDRVVLAGLSTVPATLLDLLGTITSHCDVECHLFLREGTGSYLERRLPVVWSVAHPGRVVVT